MHGLHRIPPGGAVGLAFAAVAKRNRQKNKAIRIGARESLGGGLEAFGQYEIRPNLDGSNTGVTTSLPVGSTTAAGSSLARKCSTTRATASR